MHNPIINIILHHLLSQPKNMKTEEQFKQEIKDLELSLPKEIWFGNPMVFYQGFWCRRVFLERIIAFQTYFQAHDTDIILASFPKTGTTWLKSLLFAVVNRENVSHISKLPFHTKNPYELVLHLEINVYENTLGNPPKLADVPFPRLFATHMPYHALPNSINKTTNCRIVYVCRNPFDTFVSLWHFYLQFDTSKGINPDKEMMEEYLSKYCTGVSPFGSYEDHVLGYWKESKKNPQHVLFIEYEGLKKEPKAHLKKLAEFVGYPFSEEEEKENVVDDIIELCSLKSMKEMEVNKSGNYFGMVDNKALFRKGEVGDWSNHLTTSMVKQFDQILEKLKEAGFSFTFYPVEK